MKSAMKAAAMMLMATVMTVGMASCTNDDDDQATAKKYTGAEVTISVSPATDAKEIAETTLEYTDENGQTKTKTAMGGLLTATVKFSTLPANMNITLKQTEMSGAVIVKDKYELGATVKVTTTGYCGNLPGTLTKYNDEYLTKSYAREDLPNFFKKTHILKKTLTIQTTGDGTSFTTKLL